MTHPILPIANIRAPSGSFHPTICLWVFLSFQIETCQKQNLGMSTRHAVRNAIGPPAAAQLRPCAIVLPLFLPSLHLLPMMFYNDSELCKRGGLQVYSFSPTPTTIFL